MGGPQAVKKYEIDTRDYPYLEEGTLCRAVFDMFGIKEAGITLSFGMIAKKSGITKYIGKKRKNLNNTLQMALNELSGEDCNVLYYRPGANAYCLKHKHLWVKPKSFVMKV